MNPVNKIHIVDLLGPGETLEMYRDDYDDLATTSVTTTNFNDITDEPPKTPIMSPSYCSNVGEDNNNDNKGGSDKDDSDKDGNNKNQIFSTPPPRNQPLPVSFFETPNTSPITEQRNPPNTINTPSPKLIHPFSNYFPNKTPPPPPPLVSPPPRSSIMDPKIDPSTLRTPEMRKVSTSKSPQWYYSSVSSRHFHSSFEPTPISGYDNFSYSPVSPTPSWSDFEQKYQKKIPDDEKIKIDEINHFPSSPLLLIPSPSPLSKSNSTQSIKRLFNGKSLNENILTDQKDYFDLESFPFVESNTKSLSKEKHRRRHRQHHLLLSKQLQQEANEFNNGYDGDIEYIDE
ncbi:199_t:CDS:1 [Ambispora gerdemannii]|uniref:199_t:CDS:1 n=1 Tax=Ambispora gerdemannii TaxID=144530 RepID=A0A9N8Z595_9GLOM|nr:199_t:CDS:1 [Ambispora gerdemannii]